MATSPKKHNPGGQAGVGVDALLKTELLRNSSEIAARLQRRLSAFGLIPEGLIDDVMFLQDVALIVTAGYSLASEERQRLNRVAPHLFDLRVVL